MTDSGILKGEEIGVDGNHGLQIVFAEDLDSLYRNSKHITMSE